MMIQSPGTSAEIKTDNDLILKLPVQGQTHNKDKEPGQQKSKPQMSSEGYLFSLILIKKSKWMELKCI